MTSRRRFLAGLAAASLTPKQGWAVIGAPDYLAAALFPDGSHRLVGVLADGDILFSLPLPARGHAAAAHPHRPQAVAFARRPGTFAVVIDCTTGAQTARLNAPDGRHFYGHGTFSNDGTRLFTTENDFEAGEGVIGVWDAAQYTRLGEFPSGGTGPHDMRLMADGKTLVVANGGIETHPASGRTKLNLPIMQPNLTYLDMDGAILEQAELPPALHQNSIRHLAIRSDGLVGFATQWQGQTTEHPPLLGLHRRGEAIRLLSARDAHQGRLQGYAGSIAFSGDGASVAITCPRGNMLLQFRVEDGQLIGAFELDDVCGLGPGADGFVYTTGTGSVGKLGTTVKTSVRQNCQWDNHLIPVRRPA